MTLTHILVICFIVLNFCKTATITKQLTSPFDLRNYNNTCQLTDNNATSSDCQACTDFDAIIKFAMLFACEGSEDAANFTIDLATEYKLKWSRGPTFGVIMSVRTVDLVKQFMQFYSRITLYRYFLSVKINETTEVRKTLKYLDLENTLPPIQNKTDELLFILQDYIFNIRALKNLTLKYGLENIFFTELYRGDILNDTIYSEYRELLNNTLPTREFAHMLHRAVFKLWPTFVGITFAVGVISNGILLLIFIRHSEMRTVHNVMLANLAFMDLISLIFNLPLTYMIYSKSWNYGLVTCQCFLFLRSLTLGVCTYSVVIISYQRLNAVSKFKTKRVTRLSSTMLVLALWCIVTVYSIPAFIFASTDEDYCKYNESVFIYYVCVELFVMCIVPATLVAVFSTMASIKLKQSAHNIPGERMGQEKRIQDRIVTSRVLIGLVVIFVISYLPKYVFDVLITGDKSVRQTFSNVRDEDAGRYIIVALFVEVVLFLNPALNAVVLYFLSTKFKKYFNNYILCRCRSEVS